MTKIEALVNLKVLQGLVMVLKVGKVLEGQLATFVMGFLLMDLATQGEMVHAEEVAVCLCFL